MLTTKIQQIFAGYPEVIYDYADISYSSFSKEYQFALLFAVPYEPQLTLDGYTEQGFEDSIRNARKKLEEILRKLEGALTEEAVKYNIPPVAQQNEEELEAVFSFKYAAVNAGLGWIGKNDVLITERYGPRVRLSAVLIDAPFTYGSRIAESRCPEGCMKCVDICPHKALTGRTWDIRSLRSELIDYHLCNRKRSGYIEKHGRKNSCGLCMVVCPFGKKDYEKGEVHTMKLNSSVSGAVRQFSYWFAHGTLGYPLLEGIEYIGEILKEESSFAEQAFAIFMNNLEVNDDGKVINYKYCEQRAAQFIKSYFDAEYKVEPPFEYWETELHEIE